MNRDEIMKILPHRAPMLLVDEVDIIDGVCVGEYTVRGDEFFLHGHFPGNPVVPGVILCEMMAQSACLLIDTSNGGFTPYFTGIKNVRFKNKVLPGDTVVFRSKLVAKKASFYFIKNEGFIGDSLCLSGEMSFVVVKHT